MKKILFSAIALAVSLAGYAQWKPAGDKIKTTWAEQIDPNNVLPEYPRPIMERKEWKNLNGLWEYAIRPTGTQQPADMDGQILVPFAVESSLSGVMKTLGKENELWYSREFTVPSSWKGKNILLHFGAVDWQADVWVNGVKMGQHRGGYTPFSFDITPVLAKGKNQITVKVWDPSDEGYQPRGKQVKHPDGIWYTPVSGIWQTVWMEPVSANHITRLKTTPDIDKKILTVEAHTATGNPSAVVSVVVSEGGKVVATGKAMQGQPVQLAIENARLWSPENPFLYDMKVTLTDNGKVIDEVNSYAAMRKYSIRQGADGITRLQLNNRNVFHFGPLDQGWWPDGLYTAPSDEALEFDIRKTKEMGFNMIRKHVKVEPARWYYHCDRLGMLVWQDIPNATTNTDRNEWVETNFVREAHNIMGNLKNVPSIITWVVFNEGWGQYDRKEFEGKREAYTRMAVQKVQERSNGRLVNAASGWFDYEIGDMIDKHHYPLPAVYDNSENHRAVACGEYGGINLKIDNHIWAGSEVNYTTVDNAEALKNLFIEYAGKVKELKEQKGLCAAVYTQITDVESEINGLITYDRKVIKWNERQLKEVQEVLKNIRVMK
mgnify:CR=1 FL=1